MNKWLITKLLHIVALSGKMLPESGRASYHLNPHSVQAELAQMVERSLSMREVPGSIPGASIPHFKLILDSYILSIKVGSIFTHKLFVSI